MRLGIFVTICSLLASRRPHAAALLVLCVMGCVPVTTRLSPPFASGSRLRARVWDAGEGATMFIGFHDTELDADCWFQLASDGVMRCMPQSDWLSHLDPSCTDTPVLTANVDACAPARTYVSGLGPPSATCASDATMVGYRVGERLPDQMAWFGVSTECMPYSVALCTFALEPLPPSTFVGAVARRERVDDALDQEVLFADDGALLVTGLRDVARDAPCGAVPFSSSSLREAPEWAGRCAPTDLAYSFHDEFVSADCIGAEAAYLPSTCHRPDAVSVWTAGSCGYDLTYAEAGEELATTYGLSGAPGVCTAESRSDQTDFYVVGAPLDPLGVPLLPPRLGTGRLRTVAPGVQSTLFDTELATVCAPTQFDEGYRCAPVSELAPSAPLFEDAACTVAIVAVTGLCEPPPTFAPVSGTIGLRSVHRIAARVDGLSTIYTAYADGSCVGRPVDERTTYHLLGDEVDVAVVTSVLR